MSVMLENNTHALLIAFCVDVVTIWQVFALSSFRGAQFVPDLPYEIRKAKKKRRP